MNFATLKGLTIPEGNVTKITDASGRVLWNADDGMRTITIGKSSFLSKPTYGCIVVNDETFYGSTTEEQSMQVPIGTVIEVRIIGAHTRNPSTIIVNGETVATIGDSSGTGAGSYKYTVNGDIMVSIAIMNLPAIEGMTTIYVYKTTITITEQ